MWEYVTHKVAEPYINVGYSGPPEIAHKKGVQFQLFKLFIDLFYIQESIN